MSQIWEQCPKSSIRVEKPQYDSLLQTALLLVLHSTLAIPSKCGSLPAKHWKVWLVRCKSLWT